MEPIVRADQRSNLRRCGSVAVSDNHLELVLPDEVAEALGDGGGHFVVASANCSREYRYIW